MLRKFGRRIKTRGILDTADFIIWRSLTFLPEHTFRQLFEPDIVQRHRVVVSELERLVGRGKVRILDVGAGDQGIGTYTDGSRYDIVCLDVSFSSLKATQQRGQLAVLASGTQLPFANGAFDVVASIHALEHIPDSEKQLLASQVKRCSREYVLILAPCGEHAKQLAKRLLSLNHYRKSNLSKMTKEHVRFGVPRSQFLKEQFPNCKLAWRSNMTVQLIYFSLLATPLLRWLAGISYFVVLSWFDKSPPFVESLMSWKKRDDQLR